MECMKETSFVDTGSVLSDICVTFHLSIKVVLLGLLAYICIVFNSKARQGLEIIV